MVTNQYNLWNFAFVARIHRNIDLVRNNITGQLMVRRISPAGDFAILQALCQIKHPNLMEVYDLRSQDGVCISLCEFINGTTLAFQVESGNLYDVKSARKILCQICEGLAELHSRGIVHRDIKPENIMITGDGTVKIIDYSICRLIKPNQHKDTTVLGTAGYASPEQFGFAQTNGKADIYACGVLLNYLLTGRLPNEELHQGALKHIIVRCIEIDERKRFQSAEELKMVLLGKKSNSSRAYRPLPGFRSKHVFPKIISVLFIIIWLIMLLTYIAGFPLIMKYELKYRIQQLILMVNFLFFWTLFPYILFGDVFRLSEKISPNNPRNGRYIMCFFGVLSILFGIALLFIGLHVTNNMM